MKRKIVGLLALFIMLFSFSAAPVSAASCQLYNKPAVEIFVPWYKYLPGDNDSGKCRATLPKKGSDTDVGKAAVLVIIALIELLTRVAGLIAAGFVIYGAFQYITSQGEPQGLSNAKSTIANSLIGFVIVLLAIGIVQFIGRALSY